jgi:hypothetical protein
MSLSIADLRVQAAQLAASRAALIGRAADLAATADAHLSDARLAGAVADGAGYQTATDAATAAQQARRGQLAGLADLDNQMAGLVAQLAGDPCDLEPDVPLALLPLRLETRYSPDGATLRVRIYPDDIHVDRLDRGVSEEERAAGVTYWTSIWTGSATEDAAWQTLVAAVHPLRAAWVAAATSPDLSQRPSPPGPVPAPICQPTTPREQRAAVARGLPDRFIVAVVQNGNVTTAVGSPVPVELVVGLPPSADPSQLVKQGKVVMGPGMAWLIDPVEAKAAGMLVEVPLNTPGAAVELVLAFGVRASLDPAAAAAELNRLLEGHRFASGAAFLPLGTPTNNTETDRTAWTTHPDPAPPPTEVVPAPAAGSDAAVTAASLGVDPTHLAPLSYANGTDQPLAAAAHTVLWQATWGTYLDHLEIVGPDGPGVSDGMRETWRDWWQQTVRGRGPLPLLRVADQPYGFLPAAAVLGHWQPVGGDRFEPGLLALLRNAHSVVAGGLVNVPRVGGPGPLDNTLLDILGGAPHLLGLRVRSLAAETLISYANTWFDLGGTNQASQQVLDDMLWRYLGFPPGTSIRGALGKTTRPLGLPLVDDTDGPFVEALLADQPRTVKSTLQALLDLSASREQDAITKSAPAETPGRLVNIGSQLAGDLVHEFVPLVETAMRGAADPSRLHAAADVISQRFGAAGPSSLSAQQPIAAVRTSLADDALSPALPAAAAPSLALSALGAWFRANARWAEFQAAVRTLVKAPKDQRNIVVAETLDCASHRFDAWVTALATRRLGQMRSSAPTGVLLGAYGWVERLAPGGTATRPGGYIHAPSITHGATAGVLRSGYLTHNPDMTGSGALSIDLSSSRVRRAMDVLDGVREGQPLGALLGYLIERRLHEQGLDRFTLSLRALAPVLARRLSDRADAVPQQALESIAANNVVDGLRLLQLARQTVFDALKPAPADNVYLPPNSWNPPTPVELPLLDNILNEAADAYHAVADVLLAEAVHHLVQGNTARASAAMDAAAGGDAAPVEPEVVRTPTRAAAVTHRLLLVLDDTLAGSGGWSATTPRAVAEPRLAAWAEARLGAATDVVVHVAGDGTRTTLDATGLSALDLVFDSAEPGQLDRRLRAALPAIGADPIPAVRDAAWPAGLMAVGEVAVIAAGVLRVLAGSQLLTAASFSRATDEATRVVDPSGLAARLTSVVDGLGTAAQDLAGALAANPQDEVVVAAAVDGLRPFGISMPAGGNLVAEATLAEANRRHDAATAALAVAPFDAQAAQAVGEAVFGPGFVVLTPVKASAPDLYGATFGALAPGRARVRRWLRDIATVRPAVARYAESLLFADARGVAPLLTVAQLAAAGTAGTSTWLGLPLPDGAASPDQPVTCLVVEAPAGYTAATAVAGLVIDEWVEQLPRRNADGAATVTTGLAVNAATPGARAPQTVLLAIAPDGNRWTTGAIIDLLTETLDLAKLRSVTLERTTWVGRILPALLEQSWSLQGEPTIDIKLMTSELANPSHMVAYVKDQP